MGSVQYFSYAFCHPHAAVLRKDSQQKQKEHSRRDTRARQSNSPVYQDENAAGAEALLPQLLLILYKYYDYYCYCYCRRTRIDEFEWMK